MRRGPLLLIGFAVQLAAAPAFADRAQDLAAQASSAQRRTCQNVTGLNDCHPAYPTGCSHSANPQYDAYLKSPEEPDAHAEHRDQPVHHSDDDPVTRRQHAIGHHQP